VGTIDRRICAVICIFLLLAAPINAFSGTIEHDANGNIIKKPGYRFEYNGFNQLSKVYDDINLIAEYVYDDSGNRVKAIDHINGVTTYSIGREFTRTIDSTGTHDTVYYYHDDVLVGKKDENGLFFYHPDNLGSTDIVTDEYGQLVEDNEYYPYGETPVAGKSRHQFTGQVKDTTGLLYYNARYYDPELRQFTQPDTVLQNIYDPQLLNRYAYARNNPLKYTDPSGNFLILPPLVFAAALVVATVVVSAAVGYTVGYVAGAAGKTTEQVYENFKSQQSGSFSLKLKNSIKNTNWNEVHESGKNIGTAGAITFGIQGLLEGVSNNFVGTSAPKAQVTAGQSSIEANPSIKFNPTQIQSKFKHAQNFGIQSNYNPKSAALYEKALQTHLGSQNTRAIFGTYRGTIPGTHYYNPTTQNWVFVDMQGNYLTGWKLSQSQVADLAKYQNVR